MLRVPVDVFGATSVQTLMDTAWGTSTPGLASVEFIGTGGADYVLNLVGGVDVRDYNRNVFTNTINGTTTQNVFTTSDGQNRLDKQSIALPAAFASQTLLQIAFIDNGANYSQRLFVAGVTVETATVAGNTRTQTTLVPSSGNTTVGTPVTYTATVTSPTGGAIPTGSVTFSYNYSLTNFATQTVPVQSDGTATFSISSSALAYINMRAVYSGDATYAGSASNYYTVNSNSGPLTLAGARGKIPLTILAGSPTRGIFTVKVTNPTGSTIRKPETLNVYLIDGQNNNALVGSSRRLINIPAGQTRSYPVLVRLSGHDNVQGLDQFLFDAVDATGAASLGYGVFLGIVAPNVDTTVVPGAVHPASIAIGRIGSVIVTVTSTGNVPARGLLTIALGVSTDGVNAIPGYVLKTLSKGVNLLPGRAGRYLIRFKVPVGSIPGTYFPAALVSVGGSVVVAVGATPFVVT